MNREATQDQIFRDLLRLLRRQRLLIIASVVVAVGAAVAYSQLKEPVYEASAELQFNDESQDLGALGTPVPGPADPAKQAAADSAVVTSTRVVRAVRKKLDSGLSEDEIRASVETAVDPETNLVTIQATADDAELAAKLANGFAEQTQREVTSSQRERLERAVDRLQEEIKGEKKSSFSRAVTVQRISQLQSFASFARPVVIAKRASPPGSPSSPQPVRDTILALFLGLIFGTLAAFMRDSLDRRLKDGHDVQHHLQIPVVGYVEADAMGGVGFSRNGAKPGADLAIESFRILRSNVEFLAPDRTLQTVAITSPVAEEGKSTVAAGLATASALAGKRVLLVECDLRRPVFAQRFGVPDSPGMTDWLTGTAQPADVLQQVTVEGTTMMTVIAAGTPSARPGELLGSERFRGFLDQVPEVYDLVLLDCAPLLPVGDALEVLPRVDAGLVCIRLDQTTREQALAAKAAIEHLPPRPTGVVVTGVRPGRDGYYYGYYSSFTAPRGRPVEVDPASAGKPSGSSN